jgi:hypothetical protein
MGGRASRHLLARPREPANSVDERPRRGGRVAGGRVLTGECVYAAALYASTSNDLTPTLSIWSLPGAVGIYPPDGGTPVVVNGGGAPWQSLLTTH